MTALTLSRTTRAEARKMVDTRPGVILVAVAVVLCLALPAARLATSDARTLVTSFLGLASIGPSTIATVLAVLLASSEFTASTAFTTFTLDPNRRRVLVAKALVVAGMSVAMHAMTVLVTLAAGQLAGEQAVWDLSAPLLAVNLATFLFQDLCALAVALVMRNAAGPIVVLTLWPSLSLFIAKISPLAARVVDYLDVQAPLQLTAHGTTAVLPVLVSAATCIALPALFAGRRLSHHDL